MQFVVWRNSPKARVLVEFVVTVAFAVTVHVMVGQVMDMEPALTQDIRTLLDAKALLESLDPSTAAYESLAEQIDYYYQTYMYERVDRFYQLAFIITGMGFCIMFFAHQHIPEIVYTAVTRRQYDAYNVKNLWDFLLWLLFMTYICITYGVNLGGTFAEKKTLGRDYRALYYCTNFTLNRP